MDEERGCIRNLSTAGFVEDFTYIKGTSPGNQWHIKYTAEYILHPILKCCPGTSRCHNSIMGSVLYLYVCANISCGI